MRAFTRTAIWVIVAAAAFNAAYASVYLSFLIVLYLFALLQLARADRWRLAFYPGLAVGLLIAALRLGFFWQIFSGGALALWVVYAFWVGLFVALARLCLVRFGTRWGWLLLPFVWMGLEYFRSELYYLRFSWLNAGYAFAGAPWQGILRFTGVYGIGFILLSLAAAAAYLWAHREAEPGARAVSGSQRVRGGEEQAGSGSVRWHGRLRRAGDGSRSGGWVAFLRQEARGRSLALLAVGTGAIGLMGMFSGHTPPVRSQGSVRVAGVQMEFPSENEVLLRLKDLIRLHPETQLIVLSEYTFDGPVPKSVAAWCRENKRYLIVGGKDPAPGGNFYNTAFVVGPDGRIVFRQVKAVPIQFFKDGLPAAEQTGVELALGQDRHLHLL